ncbi:MAG: PAS domain S-box protein [Gemmatimonadaceae bacterium]
MIAEHSTPIRLLVAEERPGTAERALFEFARADVAILAEVVRTPSEVRQRLRAAPFDLVISEHTRDSAEQFDIVRAVREAGCDTPVIIITPASHAVTDPSLGEPAADWVPDDRLSRLPLLVRRTVDDARVRGERAQAERRFFELADGVSDVFFTADATLQRILYINAAYERVWGDPRSRLYDDPCSFLDRVAPEHRERARDGLRRLSKGEDVPEGEFRLIWPDGSVRWVRAQGRAVFNGAGEVVRINGSARDVTEQRMAEQQVRENEEHLRLILDTTAEGICGVDDDGRCTFSNAAAARMLRFTSPDELLGRCMHDLVHSKHPDGSAYATCDCPVNLSLVDGAQVHVLDEVYWRQDGTPLAVEYWARPTVRDGVRAGAVVTFIDTSARRAAQDELAERETRYRSLTEASFDGIVTSVDGIITEVNEGFAEMFGYAPGDVIGMPATQFIDERSHDEVLGYMRGERAGRHEFLGRHADGSEVVFESAGRTHVVNGASIRISAIRDMTDRRALEAQYRQAQKMEAVGRLAGGVAHDFNNLLTVITSYTSMILEDMMRDDPRRDDLKAVLHAADGAASLTRQLLAFSRQQRIEPRLVTLDSVVENAERMLQRVIGEDIVLSTIPCATESSVCMDPGQIEQVIMNLAVNARDAMPAGGSLLIATRVEVRDATRIAEEWSAQSGRYAVLVVRDTGTGMTERTRSRLFEPFFTTKEPGKGTGLGLATIYGIVQQGGGFIEVESELGRGSEFRIYLPWVALPSLTPTPEDASLERLHGNEHVLVVEDCDAVRAATADALTRLGYRVTAVCCGEDALRVITQCEAPDVLLTDVVMPGMNGKELRDQVALRHPGIPTLFMSGYTNDVPLRALIDASDVAFIQKPFSPEQLARKLRQVLNVVAC